MTYFLFALRIVACVVLSVAALYSEIPFIAAMYGFSAGIWFMLVVKSLFEDILNPHQESRQPW
jgi:hypothetical protein